MRQVHRTYPKPNLGARRNPDLGWVKAALECNDDYLIPARSDLEHARLIRVTDLGLPTALCPIPGRAVSAGGEEQHERRHRVQKTGDGTIPSDGHLKRAKKADREVVLWGLIGDETISEHARPVKLARTELVRLSCQPKMPPYPETSIKARIPPDPTHGTVTRRQMLKHMGVVSVGLAATPVPGWPASWFRQEDLVVPFTDIPDTFTGRRGAAQEEFPGQSLVAQDLRALNSWITPVEDFFAVSHYGYPELEASSYRLELTGLVQRPSTLTLNQITSRPRVDRTTVFECSGNGAGMFHGMVGNAT
jgi:hypothetical protein